MISSRRSKRVRGTPHIPVNQAGKSFVGLSSLTYPGYSLQSAVSPAPIVGCLFKTDLTTSPGGYGITVNADGTFAIASGGDTSRQSFTADFWDIRAEALDGSFTVWVNERAPVWSSTVNVSVVSGTAITSIDLTTICTSPSGDTLTFSLVDPLPPGLSMSGSGLITGTPTTGGSTLFRVSALDSAGISSVSSSNQIVVQIPITVPNLVGLSQSTAVASIVALGLTATITYQSIAGAPGIVLNQFPAALSVVLAGNAVTIVVSVASYAVPTVTGSPVATATALVTSSGLGYLVVPQPSSLTTGTVISASPPEGTVIGQNGIVTLYVAVIITPSFINLTYVQAQAVAAASGLAVTANAPGPLQIVTTQSIQAGTPLYAIPGAIALTLSGPAPIVNFDVVSYKGPPTAPDTFSPIFPKWMYHPIYAPQIVVDLAAELVLIASDYRWTEVDPNPTV